MWTYYKTKLTTHLTRKLSVWYSLSPGILRLWVCPLDAYGPRDHSTWCCSRTRRLRLPRWKFCLRQSPDLHCRSSRGTTSSRLVVDRSTRSASHVSWLYNVSWFISKQTHEQTITYMHKPNRQHTATQIHTSNSCECGSCCCPFSVAFFISSPFPPTNKRMCEQQHLCALQHIQVHRPWEGFSCVWGLGSAWTLNVRSGLFFPLISFLFLLSTAFLFFLLSLAVKQRKQSNTHTCDVICFTHWVLENTMFVSWQAALLLMTSWVQVHSSLCPVWVLFSDENMPAQTALASQHKHSKPNN